jgi:hypothetical protein
MLAHYWELEVVVSTYQKLVGIFQNFPHLKSNLTNQHGIIFFMDMLEINNSQINYLQQSCLFIFSDFDVQTWNFIKVNI